MYEPAFEIGDTFAVITAQGTTKYYEVVFTEELQKSQDLIEDFGSLASGATSSSNKITIIELEGSAKTSSDLSELGQWWMEVMDDIQCEVKLPSAQGLHKTRNDEIRVDVNSGPVSFFTFEDDVPYITVTNPTSYTISKSRVMFWGWRIVGRLLPSLQSAMSLNVGKKPKVVAATGFSR